MGLRGREEGRIDFVPFILYIDPRSEKTDIPCSFAEDISKAIILLNTLSEAFQYNRHF